MSASIAALLDEIERDPDNGALYLVLADALVEASDPRGELIHIQHAIASDLVAAPAPKVGRVRNRRGQLHEPPRTSSGRDESHVIANLHARNRLIMRQRALIAARTTAMLGAHAQRDVLDVEFRHGFPYEVIVHAGFDHPETLAGALAAVFASPDARFVRSLVLRGEASVGGAPIAALLEQLAGVMIPPPLLQRLELGRASSVHAGLRRGLAIPDDLRRVLSVFPALAELVVDLGNSPLAWPPLASTRLRRLAWISPYVSRRELAPLAASELPALEAFTLWTGARYSTEPIDDQAEGDLADPELGWLQRTHALEVGELEPVFAMLDRCRALRELGIVNYTRELDELLRALTGHAFAEHLEVLDLSRIDLRWRDERVLAAHLAKFPALRELRLDHVALDDTHRARLAGPGRTVTGRAPSVVRTVERYRVLV